MKYKYQKILIIDYADDEILLGYVPTTSKVNFQWKQENEFLKPSQYFNLLYVKFKEVVRNLLLLYIWELLDTRQLNFPSSTMFQTI